ncbi:hypothetical protein [Cellulosimicrobium marinum]|uniref:hypothetical protein n=1 Tax=Cellulosimicrobium marinum TaxID=1638992 RepID=UPI001E48A0F6|nr:hypothetical protein [Cellulosimicrobium marinum]MCB7135138.1 hypothetical protein [Cellulosimicrobium marinum]
MTADDGAARDRGPRPRRGEASERYERSARLWLRAYPRRWRVAHEEEAVAVLLDLAPTAAGGGHLAAGIGAREAWGLLRSGWSLRRREHPPLGRWLLYRLFDVRLPARYWWWVADDVQGALFAWRLGVFNAVVTLQVVYGLPLLGQLVGIENMTLLPVWFVATLLVVLVVSGFLWRERNVARAWRKHVVFGNLPAGVPPAVDG